jgi:predicted GTPase
VIVGAAGAFHNFNLVYRGREEYDVVAFTATQIPNIEGRRYPAELAGHLYPAGIPIHPESKLEELVREHDVDEVVFSYSDVTHEHVMHIGSRVLAAGASYSLLSPHRTMLTSSRPVVAVCAVRTGSGKSQTTRHIAKLLRDDGKRVAVLRHPMPYGDLTKQASSASPTTPTWTPPTRQSRSARSTSLTSRRATWSSRGSTTRRSSTRPSRKQT